MDGKGKEEQLGDLPINFLELFLTAHNRPLKWRNAAENHPKHELVTTEPSSFQQIRGIPRAKLKTLPTLLREDTSKGRKSGRRLGGSCKQVNLKKLFSTASLRASELNKSLGDSRELTATPPRPHLPAAGP